MNDCAGPEVYYFEGFVVRVDSMELIDDAGRAVNMSSLAFQLFVHLIRNRDRVVPRDELFDVLWRDVSVGEGALFQAVWSARRAVNDTGGAQRVIKCVRGRGYRFVADLQPIEMSMASRPVDSSGSVELSGHLPIGRDRELRRLLDAFEGAASGRGRLMLLTGEMGIGKSTLLAALSVRAQEMGALVCRASCHADEAISPFGPWLEAARDLLRQLPPDAVECQLQRASAEFVRLMPELDERSCSLASEEVHDRDEASLYTRKGLTDWFLWAARDRPILLCVDDLHSADASSLSALEQIARTFTNTHVMLCCAYRDAEAPRELHEALQALDIATYQSVPVRPLGREAVDQLLELHAPTNAQVEQLVQVAKLGQGNPFFLTQLARCIDSRAQSLTLPLEAREAVRGQLRRLGEETIEVLQAAAVLGQVFRLGDLLRATNLRLDELQARIAAPLELRAIEDAPDQVGVYRFSHPVIRETVYCDISRLERSRLHARVAECIVEAHGDDITPRLDEVAHHYTAAASAGYVREALEYNQQAAEKALAITAFEAAVGHYRRALQVLDLQESVDARVHCKLLLGQGNAMRAARCAVDETRGVFADVVGRAKALGLAELQAEAAMCYAGRSSQRVSILREVGTVDATEIKLLEDALQALEGTPGRIRALVCGWLAFSLYNTREAARRRELSERAVREARCCGDVQTLAEVLNLRQSTVRGPDELDRRIETLTEIIELTTQFGPRRLALDAHQTRAWALLERGDLAAAEVDIAHARRLAAEINIPPERSSSWELMRLVSEARFEEVMRLQGVSELATPDERDRIRQGVVIRLNLIRFFQGRAEETVQMMERLAARFPLTVAWRSGLCYYYSALGRFDDARRELRGLARDDFSDVRSDHNWVTSMSLLAHVAATCEERDLCESLYMKLAPYAQRVIIVGIGGPARGTVHYPLGCLARACGADTQAIAHLEDAIRAHEHLGMPIFTALARLELARVLLSRGARDRCQVLDLIGRAEEFVRGRDLGEVARRAQELRTKLETSYPFVESRG